MALAEVENAAMIGSQLFWALLLLLMLFVETRALAKGQIDLMPEYLPVLWLLPCSLSRLALQVLHRCSKQRKIGLFKRPKGAAAAVAAASPLSSFKALLLHACGMFPAMVIYTQYLLQLCAFVLPLCVSRPFLPFLFFPSGFFSVRLVCSLEIFCRFIPAAPSTPLHLFSYNLVSIFQSRTGTEVPAEVLAAVPLALFTTLLLLTPLSLFHAFPKQQRHKTVRLLFGFCCACMLLSALRFPFSPSFPKRIILQHTLRSWHPKIKLSAQVRAVGAVVQRQDSGLWVNSMDYRNVGDLAPRHLRLSPNEELPIHECEKGSLMCDMPFYFPVDDMVCPLSLPLSFRSLVSSVPACTSFFFGLVDSNSADLRRDVTFSNTCAC